MWRWHRQVLYYSRIPNYPENPPVNLPLELSKQCLEGFELAKRELLQQFHVLSL